MLQQLFLHELSFPVFPSCSSHVPLYLVPSVDILNEQNLSVGLCWIFLIDKASS